MINVDTFDGNVKCFSKIMRLLLFVTAVCELFLSKRSEADIYFIKVIFRKALPFFIRVLQAMTSVC